MNGILLIDKPSGITSHDVVDIIRRKLNFKKIGHAGTLDPMATGLLVVLIGDSTKKAKYFIDQDKTYQANIVFGIKTDTGDINGRIIEKKQCYINRDKMLEILENFKGEIEQIPPMFSAKKHKGRKLYEYARKGIEIERKPRKIMIKKIEIKAFKKNEILLEICCSKGTYIRQLAIDIGDSLGYGACLSKLRRLQSGNFNIEQSVRLDEIDTTKSELIHENLIRNQETSSVK